MTPLRQVTVGVRSQAILIFVLTTLWWLSLFHDALFSFPNIFWVGIGYLFPFCSVETIRDCNGSANAGGCKPAP